MVSYTSPDWFRSHIRLVCCFAPLWTDWQPISAVFVCIGGRYRVEYQHWKRCQVSLLLCVLGVQSLSVISQAYCQKSAIIPERFFRASSILQGIRFASITRCCYQSYSQWGLWCSGIADLYEYIEILIVAYSGGRRNICERATEEAIEDCDYMPRGDCTDLPSGWRFFALDFCGRLLHIAAKKPY